MIARLAAIQFDRVAGTGRTRPGFVVCETASGDVVEVVAKLSANCDLGETALAVEMFSACVAGALSLPVAEPILVEMDPDWIATICDDEWRASAGRSCPLAFGSKRLPAGFGQWVPATTISSDLEQAAAGVLVFDALTDNSDRRGENPNCLVRGDAIRIIDHEMCFPSSLLGWRPPWEIGSLHLLSSPGRHIFRDALRGRDIDWTNITAAWKALTDDRLSDFAGAVPADWSAAKAVIDAAVIKVSDARDHIEDCVVEVQRVLR